MKSAYAAAALAVATLLCLGSTARADIPPPSGYVESCTVAKQLTDSSECVACNEWHGDVRCQQLAQYCFTKNCQSYGASAWTEVWCRTKSASAPTVPPDVAAGSPSLVPDAAIAPAPASCAPYSPPSPTSGESSSKCAVALAGVPTHSGAGAWAVLGLMTTLWARRRARR